MSATNRSRTPVPPLPYGPLPADDAPPTVELTLLDLYPPAIPARLPKQLRRRGHLHAATQSALTTAGVLAVLTVAALCTRGGVVLLEMAGAAQ